MEENSKLIGAGANVITQLSTLISKFAHGSNDELKSYSFNDVLNYMDNLKEVYADVMRVKDLTEHELGFVKELTDGTGATWSKSHKTEYRTERYLNIIEYIINYGKSGFDVVVGEMLLFLTVDVDDVPYIKVVENSLIILKEKVGGIFLNVDYTKEIVYELGKLHTTKYDNEFDFNNQIYLILGYCFATKLTRMQFSKIK